MTVLFIIVAAVVGFAVGVAALAWLSKYAIRLPW
jgi:ABC-type phosphate transport system permease subunit